MMKRLTTGSGYWSLLLLGILVFASTPVKAQETNSAATATNPPAAAAVTATDWNSFKILYERNIFNPNRSPRPTREPGRVRPPRYDSFTLVGTLSYEKGSFAFFDGNRSEYQKTLKASDTIAGYRIAKIAPDYVSLAGASNKMIRLPVGVQIRRPEGGLWALGGYAEPSADTPDAAGSNSDATAAPPPGAPAPPSAEENDVVKRLMLKRLSEK